MQNCLFGTRHRVDSPTDEVFPSRSEDLSSSSVQRNLSKGNSYKGAYATNLDPDIIRDPSLHETTNEGEVCVTGGRVRHLNLLEATPDELPEEQSLLSDCHGVCEGLVPIAQIGGQPDWGLRECLRGPLTVREIYWGVRFVLLGWISTGFPSAISPMNECMAITDSIGMNEMLEKELKRMDRGHVFVLTRSPITSTDGSLCIPEDNTLPLRRDSDRNLHRKSRARLARVCFPVS
jgi:hypothetical protein